MMSLVRIFALFVLLLFPGSLSLFASIQLPSVFSSNMVIQQNADVPVWGTGTPGEKITVHCSWDDKIYEATTDYTNKWKVVIRTPDAKAGSQTIIIRGSRSIVLENVMPGEVWLCAGQSNMEWRPKDGILEDAKEIASANHPYIRFFNVRKAASATAPLSDLNSYWTACTPETMQNFSAIGYFFGRELATRLEVPIGLINISWGGTNIEQWLSPEVIEKDEDFLKSAELNKKGGPEGKYSQIYNGMIAPLIPFKMAGVIWYQGESNTSHPFNYGRLLRSMIDSWRASWDDEFFFYQVQIAPYNYARVYEGALVREQQFSLRGYHKSGMVVTTDIGKLDNIHPQNKQEVGRRLAAWALSKAYLQYGFTFSGPMYKSMEIDRNTIRLQFDYVIKGLQIKGSGRSPKLQEIQIAGADRKFYDATARIDPRDASILVVSSPRVPKPVAVRYNFSNAATGNLYNSDNLPASPFRTDKWEVIPTI